MPDEISSIEITYLEGVPSNIIEELRADLLNNTASITTNEVKNRGPQNAVIDSLPEVVALYIVLQVANGFRGAAQEDLRSMGASFYRGLKNAVVQLLNGLRDHVGGLVQSRKVTPFPPLSVTFKVNESQARTFIFPPALDVAGIALATELLPTGLEDTIDWQLEAGDGEVFVFVREVGEWIPMTKRELWALLRTMTVDIENWR